MGKKIRIANKTAIPELINLEDKRKEQERADKILVEINKTLRAKKLMCDQDNFTVTVKKPKLVKPLKSNSQTRTPINRNDEKMQSPPGLTLEHLKVTKKTPDVTHLPSPTNAEPPKMITVSTPNTVEETFYLLHYKPTVQEIDNMEFHPLYEIYEHLLNDELPMYENIESLADAASFMDYYLGILNNQYLNKIKGFRLPFDSHQKVNQNANYKFHCKHDINEVKTRVAESKLKRI